MCSSEGCVFAQARSFAGICGEFMRWPPGLGLVWCPLMGETNGETLRGSFGCGED